MNMNFVDSQSSNSQCSDSLEDCTIPKVIKKNKHLMTCNGCNITSDSDNFQENLSSWAVKNK